MKYTDKKLGRLRLDTLRDINKRVGKPSWVDSPRVIKMNAKYKGVCATCEKEILVGSPIRYNLKLRKAKHSCCS